ncbi:autotransporter-associated beta strand repeat-containing protein [Paucibacter sp. PLA-PC-4]|uniref:beta strand repeat-containing protein n=1 Tax=Paucibacter sp. PLA-PC-4 TaxID=2993655 RepID=UPI00224B95B7|nr:autotransporter-associated beta strand repeat-containing protein [Paucibacter sp. PLA-PC-4]MCX2863477.1 autotransporter-associated beta strand repeat-containing protein [Paucibacter sp. PLA-PC-4]
MNPTPPQTAAAPRTRHQQLARPLALSLALAFALPMAPATGATVVTLKPGQPLTLNDALDRDYGLQWGDTVFDGQGQLVKTGAGAIRWGSAKLSFAMLAGSLIDIQAGTFYGGASGKDDWRDNRADLKVSNTGIFDGGSANVRVGALSGDGLIRTGAASGTGYQTFTLGVSHQDGSFAGVVADALGAGRLTKVGSGTQILSGDNTYTGGTHVAAGTLAIGNGGSSGTILGPVQVDAGATLAFNRSADLTFAGAISGGGQLLKQGSRVLTLNTPLDAALSVRVEAGFLEVATPWKSTAEVSILERGNVNLTGGVSELSGLLRVESGGWLTVRNGSHLRLSGDVENSGVLEFTGSSGEITGNAQLSVVFLYTDDDDRGSALQLGRSDTHTTVKYGTIYVTTGNELLVTGPNTTVKSGQLGDLRLSGETQVRVLDGAQLSTNGLKMGGSVANSASILVSGSGSQFQFLQKEQVRNSRFTIEQGGQLFGDLAAAATVLNVRDAGSIATANVMQLQAGSVDVAAGGRLQTNTFSGSFGNKSSVSGQGSVWNNTGNFTVGGGNNLSSVTLRDGGLLHTAFLDVLLGARVLLDGGQLRIDNVGSSFMAGLDWRSGRLSLGGDTALNQGLLAASLSLDPGRQLVVNGRLSVNEGQSLQLAQGGSLHVQGLTLAGGSFAVEAQADIGGSFDWQRGALTLSGEAQLGQGWLARMPVLTAQSSLNIQGSLSSSAQFAPLQIGALGRLTVHGSANLAGAIHMDGSGALVLDGNRSARLSGGITGGSLNLYAGNGELSGSAQLNNITLQAGGSGGSDSSTLQLGGGGGTTGVTVDALTLSGGSLLLITGNTTTLDGTAGAGDLLASNSQVDITNGARVRLNNISISNTAPRAPGAAPDVRVSGSGSQLLGRGGTMLTGALLSVEQGGQLHSSLDLQTNASLRVQDLGSVASVGLLSSQASTIDIAKGGQLQTGSASLMGGSASVSGSGSLWRNAGALSLGHGGTVSSLQLSQGGQLQTGSLDLGAGARLLLDGGVLSLSAPGGSFMAGLDWHSGQLNLGADTALNQGLLAASLTLDQGRQLAVQGQLSVNSGQRLQLGATGSLQAQRLLLAGGSFESAASADIGGSLAWQSGTLSLHGDARSSQGLLAAATATPLGSQQTLRVHGAMTLDGSSAWQHQGGTLEVNALHASPGSAALDWRSGSVVIHGDAALGDGLSAQLLLDSGKRLTVDGRLSIASGQSLSLQGAALNYGTLALQGGRLELHAKQALAGRFDWQQGTLALRGDAALDNAWIGGQQVFADGRHLEVGGTLALGNASLTIQDGGQVAATAIKLGTGSVLLDGGLLRTDSFGADLAGQLRWNRGTLAISGAAGASLGQGGLKKLTVLSEGQTLQVAQTLNVGRNTQLLLDGGQLSAGTLALQGGMVNSGDAALNLNGVQQLRGFGQVNGAVQGGVTTRLVASGGTLSLGDANQSGGFSHAGMLQVATGATALLLSADAARLDGRTELAAGARLLSVNGTQLGQGAELHSSGDASVEGKFINEGQVSAQGGTLSFLGDVSGTGSYAGQIQFKAGYGPGQGLAAVDFGGGQLSFGDKSVLTMEFGSASSNLGFDQLLHIGQLDFRGMLHLQFDASFKAQAGAAYTLFDFQSFTGSLSPDRIIVSGLDGQQLDLSRLAQTGQIQISPVPEPATYALWLLGLMLLAGASRIRRQPAGGHA